MISHKTLTQNTNYAFEKALSDLNCVPSSTGSQNKPKTYIWTCYKAVPPHQKEIPEFVQERFNLLLSDAVTKTLEELGYDTFLDLTSTKISTVAPESLDRPGIAEKLAKTKKSGLLISVMSATLTLKEASEKVMPKIEIFTPSGEDMIRINLEKLMRQKYKTLQLPTGILKQEKLQAE